MRRSLFWALAVLALASPAPLWAEDDVDILVPESPRFVSRADPLRTSSLAIDPDTVWIGHIADPNWRPRDRNGNVMSAAAYPSIATGGYGPYHVGRGDNRPGIGSGASYDGIWDWDHLQPGEQDSLMGWWPLARPFQTGDNVQPDDTKRPFFGLDYGNVGNYVINQGLKRTFGVTGYWHRDVGRNSQPLPDTGSVIPGPNVEWRPISGGASAWCGLRAKGDLTHIDPITGNSFNQSVLAYHGNNSGFQSGSLSPLGTDANYPGYGSQWDQMLYQDATLGSNADLHVSFAYATRMSRGVLALAEQRIGFFYSDPTKTVLHNDGNFISAADAGTNVPVDSFMVYIGLPVNDASCRYADGSFRPVFDPQRRWFSEVLRLDASGGLGNVQELLAASGETGSMARNGTITPATANLTVPSAVLSTRLGLGPSGGTVRLVFRVKTNRGFDDESFGFDQSFTSQTRGAAIIDDVSVTQGGPNLIHFGDFESAASIDNSLAVPATAAWKSTGKPPGIYVHVHTVDPSVIGAAPWNDPCSPPTLDAPGAPYRICNMVGNVLTGGDHDNAEKPGGEFGAPDQDRARWAASPTINLKSNGPGDYNAMGIDREIAQTTDLVISYEIHTAGFRGRENGNYFAWGVQSYPARQANGLEVWGEVRHAAATILSAATNTCMLSSSSLQNGRLVQTSNDDGVPDSIRVYFQFLSRCFTISGVTALTCSPSSGVLTGNHIDNVSLGLVHGEAAAPGSGISVPLKFVDAFPTTETTAFISPNFDTCAAWVRSTGNRAPAASTGNPLERTAILGDSAVAQTAIMPGSRMDLVFRILPGVGNYVQIGNPASGLRKVPTSTAPAVANAASTNFWESYMGNDGAFGTMYPGSSHAMPGGRWDPNGWCSARMDTAEANRFPCQNLSPNASNLQLGAWITTYHEDDPKYTSLGIAKNRCFAVDPSFTGKSGCKSKTTTQVSECNVICGTHPVSSQFPPLWTDDLSSGLAASENGLPPGQTYEFTKIIPDGQLTPGAHVQYFLRFEAGQSGEVDVLPDTNYVFNPGADAARWYHFSVLPDRWKDPAFGGLGMACLLVNDMADGDLDEFFWISAADSLGLTAASKRGAHNGWRARGDQGVALQGNVGGDDSIARRDNGGQPGTLWDLWNGGDDAAGLGNRAAAQPLPGELIEGKATRTGPTGDMLRWFYRNLLILASHSNSHSFGRVSNRTNDDLAMLDDFAINSAGTTKPRAVYVIGSEFCEALTQNDPPEGGAAFLATYFGLTLRNKAYRYFSGNQKRVAQYVPGPGTAVDQVGSGFGWSGMRLGVSDGCGLENDVLEVNTAVPTAAAQMFYENVGGLGPYVGAIYAPNGSGHDQVTYLDGTRIGQIGSIITYDQRGESILPLKSAGLRAYLFKSLTVAARLDCGSLAPPVGVGDNPGAGVAFVNSMHLASRNPMRHGSARIAFGLAKSERVEIRVYDVTGRAVKTIVDRLFVAGAEHVVIWDGTNDAGGRVRSGVYFYRLQTPTWTSQKKLTLLTD